MLHRFHFASMEPGHEDREYPLGKLLNLLVLHIASMEPGHEDREYIPDATPEIIEFVMPQWSPVMKTGNTRTPAAAHARRGGASMEPGHEDREYDEMWPILWTSGSASMEPGHEDREYFELGSQLEGWEEASMEPGHEDREYRQLDELLHHRAQRLNGARS